MRRSASSSPLRKKLRLSSPTYDAQFADLDPYDIQALEDTETRLSQDNYTAPSSSHTPVNTFERNEKRRRVIEDALKRSEVHELEEHDDSGIMFTGGDVIDSYVHGCGPTTARALPQSSSHTGGFISTTSFPLTREAAPSASLSTTALGFTSAASLASSTPCSNAPAHRLPSPDVPQEQDHNAWFTSADTPLPTDFASASALRPLSSESAGDIARSDLVESDITPSIGFKRASGTAWTAPSVAALELAKKKLDVWGAEIEAELSTVNPSEKAGDHNAVEDKQLARKPLQGVENSVVSPVTSEFTSAPANSDTRPAPAPPHPSKASAFATPLRIDNAATPSRAPRSFVSNPVLARSSAGASITLPGVPVASPSHLSPATPIRLTTTRPPPRTPKPSTPSTFITPRPAGSSQQQGATPQKARPLGLTPRSHAFSGSGVRPKFVTPFKQGMRPGESGRDALVLPSEPNTQVQPLYEGKGKGRTVVSIATKKVKSDDVDKRIFNLVTPINRKTLANCGLTPQFYTNDELTEMGFGAGLFSLTNVSHFLYYRFNPADASAATDTIPSTQVPLGPDSALMALLGMGCNLATKAWVDNHWSLILWKMIGMACLEPSKLESKWCWDEVMRQLRYRYARELANGSRPALRLITTQDAPPSGPLVLCVSDIFWTDECIDAEGRFVPAQPELELTDGWYRLRASVDEVLARAARTKILRVGRKIACSGARLESSKKDPMEVLDAYGSTHLVISGNSTHLAPWHVKLGFQTAPFVATLGSLTSDGGGVALMDLIVTEVFPVGFIEFITAENGEIIREGPRTKKDEAVEEDRWKERRSHEAVKLREELEKKLHRLESYADSLKRTAGSAFQPPEDESPPDNVEDLAEELEDCEDPAALVRSVDKRDAGWLSQSLRKKCEIDRERGGEEIDRELSISFPPRQVRNFRVLRVKDAQTLRKPSWRTAQLTVWDVMSWNATEGGSAGSFAVGQRYMVTSLVPSQPSAWMGLEPGSEVYLSTRRGSKWKIIG